MKVNDRVVGLCGIVVSTGLFFTIKDAFFKTKALPIVILALLFIVSLLLALRKNHKSYVFENIQDVLIAIILLVGYVLMLPNIGFILSTLSFLILNIWIFKYEGKIIVKLLFILLFPLIIFYIFRIQLHVRLPEIIF